jgi:hypothetical protein
MHPNHPSQLVFVENQSRIGLWRPVIFKYYESYFDVLHMLASEVAY